MLASPSFDGIIFELWGALLNGGCCVIFPDRWPEFGRLEQVIRERRVSCLFLTTRFFNQIIDHRPQALATARTVLVGGEALSPRHIRRAQETLPHLKLVNGYGPAECTTFACAYRIALTAQWRCGSVPIGLPLNNIDFHIVDETHAPVAINQPGGRPGAWPGDISIAPNSRRKNSSGIPSIPIPPPGCTGRATAAAGCRTA